MIALVMSLLLISGWELFWRSQGRAPNLDDNKNLWALQRAKIEVPSKDQVVFIGSSRILFNIQREIWQKHTQTDAVMLGVQGGSPLPVLKNIVEESDYRGLLIVGVAPDIFFWANTEDGFSWKRPTVLLDYFNDRTYAQRLNYELSVPLQENLAFYRDGDEEWSDDVDLKTLLRNCRSGERAGTLSPPFYNFEDVQLDRNVEMTERATKDTALANTVIRAWGLDEWEKEIEDKEGYEKMLKDLQIKRKETIDFFLKYAKQYREEGGSIVLVRNPSVGKYRKLEQRDFPREICWDSLVIQSKLPAIHFEDYEQLMGLNLPELSHLSKEDADYYTLQIIRILEKEGILRPLKDQ